jgi:UPF0716 protein FxsA
MRALIPLLLLALPLAEIAVFVMVGSEIGALATIALVIATTILGAVLLRVQGFGVIQRIRNSVEQGGTPTRELVHGLMILAAGILLVLPGFITDAIGLLLFIPPVRDFAWRLVRNRVVVRGGVFQAGMGRGFSRRNGRTIDLDAEEYSTRQRTDPDRPRLDEH